MLTRPLHSHNLGWRRALRARLLGLQDGRQLGVADQAREDDKWGMIVGGFRSCARLRQGIPSSLPLGRHMLLILPGSNM